MSGSHESVACVIVGISFTETMSPWAAPASRSIAATRVPLGSTLACKVAIVDFVEAPVQGAFTPCALSLSSNSIYDCKKPVILSVGAVPVASSTPPPNGPKNVSHDS